MPSGLNRRVRASLPNLRCPTRGSWFGPALVVLVLRANFCSIYSSGLHSTATLILIDVPELVGLPSFSLPSEPKGRTRPETF